jgi:hypothetical protein
MDGTDWVHLTYGNLTLKMIPVIHDCHDHKITMVLITYTRLFCTAKGTRDLMFE